MESKVSIIIPTYNGEKYIKETIESCLNQSYKNLEIIVTDDASADSTVEILKFYRNKIKYFTSEQNQGISRNVNKGIDLSTGKYFVLLGQDDLLAKNHVEVMINEFDENTAYVHCNSFLIDAQGKIFGIGVNDFTQKIKTKFIKIFLSLGTVVHSTGTMVKKECFCKVNGWDETFKNYGEWLVWIKMASTGKVKYCTKIKAYYRRHDTNITNGFQNEYIKVDLLNYRNYCSQQAIKNLNIFELAFFKLLKLLKKVRK